MKRLGPFDGSDRAPVATVPCACGGAIGVLAAERHDGRAVAPAVQRHHRTTAHRIWRNSGGLERWQERHGSSEQVPVVRE